MQNQSKIKNIIGIFLLIGLISISPQIYLLEYEKSKIDSTYFTTMSNYGRLLETIRVIQKDNPVKKEYIDRAEELNRTLKQYALSSKQLKKYNIYFYSKYFNENLVNFNKLCTDYFSDLKELYLDSSVETKNLIVFFDKQCIFLYNSMARLPQKIDSYNKIVKNIPLTKLKPFFNHYQEVKLE